MKKIITITLCIIALIWTSVLAYKYIEKPKVIERIIEVEINDVYYEGVKIKGDCALVFPQTPCWTFIYEFESKNGRALIIE